MKCSACDGDGYIESAAIIIGVPVFPADPGLLACRHGGQRNKCEICERDQRIAELEAEIAHLTMRTHNAEADVRELSSEQAKLVRALDSTLTRMGIPNGPWTVEGRKNHTGYARDSKGRTWIDDDYDAEELVKNLNAVADSFKE